eukprot:TRINITY_DN1004_c0_g2_i2.p7 TRINITY_DN1004_c0_g2~~TRINITY_DN1004_c0_g2_i2.p7  ORF type:complete len:138 (+),score=8.27 TRINITY_DN1004_c0_g2_i2:1857-2270(+)
MAILMVLQKSLFLLQKYQDCILQQQYILERNHKMRFVSRYPPCGCLVPPMFVCCTINCNAPLLSQLLQKITRFKEKNSKKLIVKNIVQKMFTRKIIFLIEEKKSRKKHTVEKKYGINYLFIPINQSINQSINKLQQV